MHIEYCFSLICLSFKTMMDFINVIWCFNKLVSRPRPTVFLTETSVALHVSSFVTLIIWRYWCWSRGILWCFMSLINWKSEKNKNSSSAWFPDSYPWNINNSTIRRAFPRDLLAERWLIIHDYNLFMSSMFITWYLILIKCASVICCWQGPQKHSLPRVIRAWKSIVKKNTISSRLFLIRTSSTITLQNDTVLLFEQRGAKKK